MKKKRGAEALLGIKIDMNKAYDKMERELIVQVMRRLGFLDQFCHLIKQCLTKVNYSILLNGSKFRYIQPTRNLKQGDPISSYLFIIGAEALFRMTAKAEA